MCDGGQLENASTCSYDKNIIIIYLHFFRAKHLKLLHIGPQLLLVSTRARHWPLGGRNLARDTYYQLWEIYLTKV